MRSWDERQRSFLESKLVEKGQKLIWLKGGAAQGHGESPLVTVWFVEAGKYSWRVIDKDSVLHGALPSRLFTVWQFQEWVEDWRNEPLPPKAQALLYPEVPVELQ